MCTIIGKYVNKLENKNIISELADNVLLKLLLCKAAMQGFWIDVNNSFLGVWLGVMLVNWKDRNTIRCKISKKR